MRLRVRIEEANLERVVKERITFNSENQTRETPSYTEKVLTQIFGMARLKVQRKLLDNIFEKVYSSRLREIVNGTQQKLKENYESSN